MVNFRVSLFASERRFEEQAFAGALSDLSFSRHLEQAGRGESLLPGGDTDGRSVRGTRTDLTYTLYDAPGRDPFRTHIPTAFSDMRFAFLGDPPTGFDLSGPEAGMEPALATDATLGKRGGVGPQHLPGSVWAALVALIGLVAVARRNVAGGQRR